MLDKDSNPSHDIESPHITFFPNNRQLFLCSLFLPDAGININGHHLMEFSVSIDNKTSLSWSKSKIRLASLWLMVSKRSSDHPVQTNHLLHNHSHSTSVNMKTNKIPHNQLQSRRRKRKLKHETESDINLYHFKNHSYNHITNDNHIIKSNLNPIRRRKFKSINVVNRNAFSQKNIIKREQQLEKNLTLWIFRMRTPIESTHVMNDLSDKVSEIL